MASQHNVSIKNDMGISPMNNLIAHIKINQYQKEWNEKYGHGDHSNYLSIYKQKANHIKNRPNHILVSSITTTLDKLLYQTGWINQGKL